MVKAVRKGTKTFYKCNVCGLVYREKEIAEKCQNWCETHEGTCNLEYVQHAVDLDE